MKKSKLVLAIILFSVTQIISQQVAIDFTITDGTSVVPLRAGLDPAATDGFDFGIDIEAPPPPPAGVFDARFVLPDFSAGSVEALADFRAGDNTVASEGLSAVYRIKWVLGTGGVGPTLSWDIWGVNLLIKDDFGLVNEDIITYGAGSILVPNPLLTALNITISYIESPFPVELTSFTALLAEEAVKLNWETATEVNNYGFDIERCDDSENWKKIGFVDGHGNSNSPKSYSFEDDELISAKIQYRLKQIDTDGSFEYSDVVEVSVDTPTEFKLVQNFPNPFNPTTEISYSLAKASDVSLSIYNSLGQEVANIINERQEAGRFNVTFNAADLPSGIYYYAIRANENFSVKKMMLLK